MAGVILAWMAMGGQAIAKDPVYAHVQVATPYIELHTGPGRGYPIFHVVKNGEWVDVMKRRTDWFKIRTAKGKIGWVSRADMETTITETGVKSVFRGNAFEEFFESRMEAGAMGGYFKSDPLMVMQVAYRLEKNLTTELSYAQVSGTFASFRMAYLNLTTYPWHDTRFSPYFAVGAGSFESMPRGTLVTAQKISATEATVAMGARYHISRNFVFRLEYRYHNVFINQNQTEQYPAWSAGFSFF